MASGRYLIRRTTVPDAGFLPEVENSAGKAFSSIPELAWVAYDDAQTVLRHLELIRKGASWVAVPEDDASSSGAGTGTGPVAFLNGELIDDHFHIWEMSVHHQHQRRGIGRRLVQSAINYAATQRQHRPCKGLTLTTFLDVPWNDQFYKTMGFVMLQPQDLTPALTKILNDEARAGLPRERRCAMRLDLDTNSATHGGGMASDVSL